MSSTTAPASCPGEDGFANLIAQRTSRAKRSGASQGKYRFTVEVALNEGGARGKLRIAEKDGGNAQVQNPRGSTLTSCGYSGVNRMG
jgi:hypothetical protein